MSRLYEPPANWVEFLDDLMLEKSGLRTIRLEGSLIHPTNKTGYGIEYRNPEFDGQTVHLSIQRVNHEDTSEKLRGLGDWVFEPEKILPPIGEPEVLSFRLSGGLDSTSRFYRDIGRRSAEQGYELDYVHLSLNPEFTLIHVVMNLREALVNDHPYLDKQVSLLDKKYKTKPLSK